MTTGSDDPDNWVLDEDWVRRGRHEPPARTRDAVARLGGQRSSWRAPGAPAGERTGRQARRSGRPGRGSGRLRRGRTAGTGGRPVRRTGRRWWQLSLRLSPGMQWLVGLVLLAALAVVVVLLAR